jgi:hypothetical protein
MSLYGHSPSALITPHALGINYRSAASVISPTYLQPELSSPHGIKVLQMMASPNLAFLKLASLKLASLKSAHLKLAPPKSAPVKSAPVKSVYLKTAPFKLAPLKPAPFKSAQLKSHSSQTLSTSSFLRSVSSNAIAVELPQRMIANKRETVGFFKLCILFKLRDDCKYIANLCFGSRSPASEKPSGGVTLGSRLQIALNLVLMIGRKRPQAALR